MISNPGPVAIIGAGVAGLSAAYHLAQAGRRVVMLEAQERVGGRILTRSGVELGAEFIHGRPKATVELLREAHIEQSPLDGEHWQRANGRLELMADNSDELRELIALASRKRGDRSVREFLDEVGADPARRDAASWMQRIVEGFDAADPAVASLKSIVSEWSGSVSTEAEQSRPVGGYTGLVDFMLHRLDPTLVRVRRNTPVQHVHWSAKGAELTVSAESSQAFDATAVIITVPLSLLKSEVIQFDPPLDAKAKALAGLAMGPVHRVMLRYPTAIWEALLGGPVRAGTFLHAPGQTFPTFWTHDPGSPWLTAWCGGPQAARLDTGDDIAIIAAATESARAILSSAAGASPDPVAVQFHNWQRDPWSLGSYTYVAVGGIKARKALARPLDGVLYFAGEATDSTGEGSTVAGAIMSGTRAAKEVIKDHGGGTL
jgi:monoamine oxidase